MDDGSYGTRRWSRSPRIDQPPQTIIDSKTKETAKKMKHVTLANSKIKARLFLVGDWGWLGQVLVGTVPLSAKRIA